MIGNRWPQRTPYQLYLYLPSFFLFFFVENHPKRTLEASYVMCHINCLWYLKAHKFRLKLSHNDTIWELDAGPRAALSSGHLCVFSTIVCGEKQPVCARLTYNIRQCLCTVWVGIFRLVWKSIRNGSRIYKCKLYWCERSAECSENECVFVILYIYRYIWVTRCGLLRSICIIYAI